jgi:beta-glucanase (GH16 family)
MVFVDEFDALDLSPDGQGVHTWYEGVWYNQKHAPLRNISAAGSILSLTWRRGQDAEDTSITTLSRDAQHFKAWRYGYFEARMRWNVVKGAWPAFWLIPVQNATGQDVYDGTKRSGEIDVFEGLGDHPHTFYGTIHEWINSKTDHASRDNTFRLPRDADMSQFHTYGLLWIPGKVTWYFDNRPLHTEETPAIVDKQDFFLVLSMQEGQDWKYGDLSGVTAPSMTLNVDWVRVWQK